MIRNNRNKNIARSKEKRLASLENWRENEVVMALNAKKDNGNYLSKCF